MNEFVGKKSKIAKKMSKKHTAKNRYQDVEKLEQQLKEYTPEKGVDRFKIPVIELGLSLWLSDWGIEGKVLEAEHRGHFQKTADQLWWSFYIQLHEAR